MQETNLKRLSRIIQIHYSGISNFFKVQWDIGANRFVFANFVTSYYLEKIYQVTYLILKFKMIFHIFDVLVKFMGHFSGSKTFKLS